MCTHIYKYINIYNKITQVDSTRGYVGRLFRKSPRIYRSASVYFVYLCGCPCFPCVHAQVYVCVYVCVCNISFSLAECWHSRKTGSQMFNKPRGGHHRAARYNRRDSYVHSKLSKMTKFVVHTLEREHLRIQSDNKGLRGMVLVDLGKTPRGERKLLMRSLFSAVPVKSPRSSRVIPNYIC